MIQALYSICFLHNAIIEQEKRRPKNKLEL